MKKKKKKALYFLLIWPGEKLFLDQKPGIESASFQQDMSAGCSGKRNPGYLKALLHSVASSHCCSLTFCGKATSFTSDFISKHPLKGKVSFLIWRYLKGNANVCTACAITKVCNTCNANDCSWGPDDTNILIVTEMLMDGSNCSANYVNNASYSCGAWGWIHTRLHGHEAWLCVQPPCFPQKSEGRSHFRNNCCHS